MKQNGFIFEVGDLIREEQGTRYSFEIDEKNTLKLGEDHPPASPIKGKVIFMKVEDGIHVQVEDIELVLGFKCMKCTEDYKQKVSIQMAERVYFFEKQKDVDDELDVFYIDMKNTTVDISDFLRQEIILHFPMIPVCSNSCKGLCPLCGKNLNKNKCSCKKINKEEKPLSILKKLLK